MELNHHKMDVSYMWIVNNKGVTKQFYTYGDQWHNDTDVVITTHYHDLINNITLIKPVHQEVSMIHVWSNTMKDDETEWQSQSYNNTL